MNVAVVDQQLTFADTVATRLLTQEDVRRATAHTSTESLLAAVRTEPVNVVLIDWGLCATDSGPLVPQLWEEDPNVGIVVAGTHSSPGDIVAALEAGALGWVPKDVPFDELPQRAALRRARRALDPGTAPHVGARDDVPGSPQRARPFGLAALADATRGRGPPVHGRRPAPEPDRRRARHVAQHGADARAERAPEARGALLPPSCGHRATVRSRRHGPPPFPHSEQATVT